MAYQLFSNKRSIETDITQLQIKLYGKNIRCSDGMIRRKQVNLKSFEEVVKVEVQQDDLIVEIPFEIIRYNIIVTLDLNKIPLKLGYFDVVVTTKKKSTGALTVSKGRFKNKVAPKQVAMKEVKKQEHESLIEQLTNNLLEGNIDG